jgi:hypothetical protein
MRSRAKTLVLCMLALVAAGPLRAYGQQPAPVAVTGAALAPTAQFSTIFGAVQPIAMQGATPTRPLSTDHVGTAPWRTILIGALIGGAVGAGAGYGLALLGHNAYCEGTVQCAERPTRAIRESTRGGLVLGVSVGAVVGWRVSAR